jgi:hypothetical protein
LRADTVNKLKKALPELEKEVKIFEMASFMNICWH